MIGTDPFAGIAAELAHFEQELAGQLSNDDIAVRDSMARLVSAGGKRLRPALTLLTAQLGEFRAADVNPVAAGIELIHTATLVHDDIIDASPTRRGVAAVHTQSGTATAIVVGDYYLAKGLALVARAGSDVGERAAQCVMTICAGEALHAQSGFLAGDDLAAYERAIERKTASLIELCCYAGGTLGGIDTAGLEALIGFGHNLGMAFQVVDDLLDYEESELSTGKPTAVDLVRGTVTLPLIYALKDPVAGVQLRDLLGGELGADSGARALALVRQTDALPKTRDYARGKANAARQQLSMFAATQARQALDDICTYVVDRHS